MGMGNMQRRAEKPDQKYIKPSQPQATCTSHIHERHLPEGGLTCLSTLPLTNGKRAAITSPLAKANLQAASSAYRPHTLRWARLLCHIQHNMTPTRDRGIGPFMGQGVSTSPYPHSLPWGHLPRHISRYLSVSSIWCLSCDQFIHTSPLPLPAATFFCSSLSISPCLVSLSCPHSAAVLSMRRTLPASGNIWASRILPTRGARGLIPRRYHVTRGEHGLWLYYVATAETAGGGHTLAHL